MTDCLRLKVDFSKREIAYNNVNQIEYLNLHGEYACFHNIVSLENRNLSLTLLKAKCGEVLYQAKVLSDQKKNEEAISLIENFIVDHDNFFKDIVKEEKKKGLQITKLEKIDEKDELNEKDKEDLNKSFENNKSKEKINTNEGYYENINYYFIAERDQVIQLKKDLDNFILALNPQNYVNYGRARIVEKYNSHLYQKECNDYYDEYDENFNFGYSNSSSKKFRLKSSQLKKKLFLGLD